MTERTLIERREQAARLETTPAAWVERMFRRRQRAILVWALGGLAVGLAFGFLRTPVFEAVALIELRTPNASYLNVNDVTPHAEPQAAARSEMDTAVRLLESRSLRDVALAALGPDLAADKELSSSLVRDTQVARSDESRLIEIISRAPDPAVAADYANSLAAAYLARTQSARRESASGTESWIDQRIEDYRARLTDSERLLQEMAAAGAMATPSPERLAASDDRLARAEQALFQARSQKLERQARVESLGDDDPASLPEGADFQLLRGHLSRLAELRDELARLEAVYTPAHYQVRQTAAQVAEIETAAAAERARLREQAQRDYHTAALHEGMLETEYAGQRDLAVSDARSAIEFRIAERDVEANRKLYEVFLDLKQQAGVAAAAPTTTASLVDPAAAPEIPLEPSTAMLAALGLGCGLFLGICWGTFREASDRTASRPGDLARLAGVAELGVIPEEQSANRRRLTSAAPPRTRSGGLELGSVERRSSLQAESFRGLRTALLWGTGRNPRVVAVTSARAGEGKTTAAANLALSLAELGERVLIVDADLRRPRLHEIFAVRNQVGLCDVVAAGSRPAEIDRAVLAAHGAPGVYVLPSGVAESGGPGLLHSPAFGRLIDALRQRFDRIILDGPPAPAVSDARTMARLADGAMVVVRAGATDIEEVERTAELLRSEGAAVLGAVLNAWDARRLGYGPYRPHSDYQEAAAGPRDMHAAA